MTSIQEGQPVSALEAACCGLPIFSTICGGVEDYVTTDLGRLYRMEDYESFSNGLKDFLEGRLSFDPLYIRETVISQYGKAAFVNSFVGAVMDVLKCNSGVNQRGRE
jgi:glycosyltransferase involved in cell wall biosynthesis